MKKIIIFVSSCIVLSICVVVVLHKTSNQLLHIKNIFTRFFPSHPLDYIGELNIKYNSYYISGTTTEHIYLGNHTAPLHLLSTNYQLSDTTHIQLQTTDTGKFKSSRIPVSVDYPHIYLTEGITPAIYYGDLSKSNIISRHKSSQIFDSLHFNMAVPVSPSSFVLRTYNSTLQQNILTKISTDSSLIHAPNILEKQIDGIFCTDGMLHYIPDLNWLVYVYYYRNEFICFDTDLNIIHKGNTIDTISQAQIKVASYSSGKKTSLSAPPLTINRKSCIENDRLYINSTLMAKNEDEERFKNNSVIDVYSLTDKRYLFSFYLSNFNQKKMRNFFVSDKKIVALYDNYIVTYQLNY